MSSCSFHAGVTIDTQRGRAAAEAVSPSNPCSHQEVAVALAAELAAVLALPAWSMALVALGGHARSRQHQLLPWVPVAAPTCPDPPAVMLGCCSNIPGDRGWGCWHCCARHWCRAPAFSLLARTLGSLQISVHQPMQHAPAWFRSCAALEV